MSHDQALPAAVFHRYPHAIVVLDVVGRMVDANDRAKRLLRTHVPPGSGDKPRFGCELIGCRRADGPLQEVCLHELALEHDGPLPEIRLDLPLARGAGATWVTVAALNTRPERIVMELRPRDDQWRTDALLRRRPTLRIRAFGRTSVTGPDGPIDGRWLDNRPGQILKFLVANRHRPVHSDEIVETLWTDARGLDTRGLRYSLHVLRKHLEPERDPRSASPVLAGQGGYALDPARVWIDATAFEEHVEAGLAAHERGDVEVATDQIERGLALYVGDFLADEPYAEWAVQERDRLRRMAGKGLRALGEMRVDESNLPGATECFLALAELEQFDVDVHRRLLVLLLRQGRRSEAVRRYDALRRRMLTTFGEPLDFTLMQLIA
ncbi:MAG: BTAD domain-containing putative transcriptional regulator [Solirubrobacteraceae bacterium]